MNEVRRYRKLEEFFDKLVEKTVISDKIGTTLATLAAECDYQTRVVVDTSNEISVELAKFASQVKNFGALHSSPSGYSRFNLLEARVQVLEANIRSLVRMIKVVLTGEALVTAVNIIDGKSAD